MMDSALARRIEMIGWSTVVLGIACIALAALQAVTPILFRRFAAVFDDPADPTRSMREAWSAGAVLGAWLNGVFGVLLAIVGVAVARGARWAHGALTASCWISIAILAVLAKPTLAPVFAMRGEGAAAGRTLFVASVALIVVQVAAVLWFLRFWRKPEVRAAFVDTRTGR